MQKICKLGKKLANCMPCLLLIVMSQVTPQVFGVNWEWGGEWGGGVGGVGGGKLN